MSVEVYVFQTLASNSGRDADELEAILAKVPDPDRRAAWRSAYTQSTPRDALAESDLRLQACVEEVEQALRRSTWLAGETYFLADIDLHNFYAMAIDWMPGLVNETVAPPRWPGAPRTPDRRAVRALRAATKGLLTARPSSGN